MKNLAWVVSSIPIQRTANTRRKCPLEKSSTFPPTARMRLTARSARHDLSRRFPFGAAVAEQLPVVALGPNFGRPASLILAVVPFQQIAIDFGDAPKAGQSTCPAGALQRAGEDIGERQSFQALLKPGGVALAALGERQIGQS